MIEHVLLLTGASDDPRHVGSIVVVNHPAVPPQALQLVLTLLPPAFLPIPATAESLSATNDFSKDLNSLLTLFCISAPKRRSFLYAVPAGFKITQKIQYFGAHQ